MCHIVINIKESAPGRWRIRAVHCTGEPGERQAGKRCLLFYRSNLLYIARHGAILYIESCTSTRVDIIEGYKNNKRCDVGYICAVLFVSVVCLYTL